MNFNRKTVLLGLTALILVWVGNFYYFQLHQLKEPIFLKHYYDLRFEGDILFDIYCIQNRNDSSSVIGLEIPGFSQLFVSGTETESSVYKYFEVTTVSLRIDKAVFDSLVKSRHLTINEVKLYFSNGKSKKAALGEIHITSAPVQDPLLAMHSSSGSSDNTGRYLFASGTHLKLIGIKHKFSGKLAGFLNLSLNGRSVEETPFPLELKQRDTLEIMYSFKFSKDLNNLAFNTYNIAIPIKFQKENGETAVSTFWVRYVPDFHDKKMLKEFVFKRN